MARLPTQLRPKSFGSSPRKSTTTRSWAKLGTGLAQTPDRLDGTEDTDDAVEAAAAAHGVGVRTGDDRAGQPGRAGQTVPMRLAAASVSTSRPASSILAGHPVAPVAGRTLEKTRRVQPGSLAGPGTTRASRGRPRPGRGRVRLAGSRRAPSRRPVPISATPMICLHLLEGEAVARARRQAAGSDRSTTKSATSRPCVISAMETGRPSSSDSVAMTSG